MLHDRLEPGRLAMFLFHGVVPRHRHPVRNYTRKHIDADRFSEVLEDLLAHGTPMSLDAALEAIAGRRPLPDRAFVITFDDGFRNNARVAAPILRRLGVPATFYVTSHFVDAGTGSWIDLIERAVAASDAPTLAIPSLGATYPIADAAQKRAALDDIRRRVKADGEADPYAIAAQVVSALGDGPPDLDLDAMMEWEDVRTLDADPLFTIGGHGRTHRILSYLADGPLAHEIALSVDAFRSRGIALHHYSYPEGLAHCFDDRVIRHLRAHGIVASPTAIDGTCGPGDDPFRLHRIMVV